MNILQTYSKNGQVNQQASADRPVSSLLVGTAASIPLRFSCVFCSCAGGTLFSMNIFLIVFNNLKQT